MEATQKKNAHYAKEASAVDTLFKESFVFLLVDPHIHYYVLFIISLLIL